MEQHGNAEAKIRPIDDFRASGINVIVETGDTNIPENLDVFIAISLYIALVSPGCGLWCANAEFAHAYKHVPILDDQEEFATIILAGPDWKVKAATLRTHPFRSRRAPANWSMVTLFLKWVMANLFGVVIAVYVDDVFIIEPKATISAAFECFKCACEILGFQLYVSKEQAPTETPSLLGADVSILSKWITARLPERKRKDLINELNQTLQNGTLTPAQAAKLRERSDLVNL